MHRRGPAGVAMFSLFLAVAAALPVSAQQTPAPIAPPAAAPTDDTTALAREAVQWLADLIRINTTNPPGNEQAAARYIAGILEKEGVTPELLEVAPGRSAVVARLRSSALADPSRALLLVGHLDVIGVERARWTVDPFAAVEKDGYLYGRGSLDDKGMVAANLAVFIALKRANARLNRDVIFLATCDEEREGIAPDAGIKTLIAKYWDKFAAGFALNEGGYVVVKNGKVLYAAVQAIEKVEVNVSVVARGPSGHASQPGKDNAVVHLSAAIAKIGTYSAPVRPTAIVRRFFEELARIEDPEIGKWMRALETSDRGEHAQRVISEANPLWNSMLRDSIAPTMLSAGTFPSAIPSEARAVLNMRLVPGNSVNALVAELTRLVNDPQVRFEVMPGAGFPAPPSALDSELYLAIEKASQEQFPGIAVLPLQGTGTTDSAQLRLHKVEAYGLRPFPMTEEDLRRSHADDERIPLSAFAQGVQFLYRIVSEFAIAK
jgi:acetylornithine deacetylase/succinyl-diaminopimelate desuccinylase-like protein